MCIGKFLFSISGDILICVQIIIADLWISKKYLHLVYGLATGVNNLSTALCMFLTPWLVNHFNNISEAYFYMFLLMNISLVATIFYSILDSKFGHLSKSQNFQNISQKKDELQEKNHLKEESVVLSIFNLCSSEKLRSFRPEYYGILGVQGTTNITFYCFSSIAFD